MKVGITYDLRDYYLSLGFCEDDAAEFDSPVTIDAIDNALVDFGFFTEKIGNVKQLAEKLIKGEKWHFIFNIAEGVSGIGREAQIPAICDVYGIPYTFSDPCIMSLTLNKALTKRVIRDLGIATPDFKLLKSLDDIEDIAFGYPMFAKPYAEGTGKGIDALSVINDRASLTGVCAALLEKYKQPVLVEEYLCGREFTVGIAGSDDNAVVIGVMEVILNEKAESGVYSYMNKEYCDDRVIYALVDDPTAQKAGELALASWKGLGCVDAGRVDVRCDRFGTPNFIEVNPLAGLHPHHSDLPMICTKAGFNFADLIGTIMQSSLDRCGLLDAAPDKMKKFINPFGKTAENFLRTGSGRGKVVILHQHADATNLKDEQDVLVQRDEIFASLAKQGYEPVTMEMNLDVGFVGKALKRLNPAVVFNLVESIEGHDMLMGMAPALLASLALKFTGSGFEVIAVTGNKTAAKKIMTAAGIPTPDFISGLQMDPHELPEGEYIVKSVYDHASAGMDDDSIIRIGNKGNLFDIKAAAAKCRTDFFIERYIAGREFNISIIEGPGGPELLPPAEIKFENYPADKPRIVSYKAKWDPDSFEYTNTVRCFEFGESEKPLLDTLCRYALDCWTVFGLKGYARVDFRVDEAGNPWVLEVNANPCLTSDAGFMAAAKLKGMTYDEVIARIIGL